MQIISLHAIFFRTYGARPRFINFMCVWLKQNWTTISACNWLEIWPVPPPETECYFSLVGNPAKVISPLSLKVTRFISRYPCSQLELVIHFIGDPTPIMNMKAQHALHHNYSVNVNIEYKTLVKVNLINSDMEISRMVDVQYSKIYSPVIYNFIKYFHPKS